MKKSPIALCAAALGGLALLLSLVSALGVEAPSVSPDEWGYLLNGQVLLGRHETFIPFAKFYGPVYGLISAAGALVTGSLHGAYRFDLVANVLVNVIVAGLCARIARRMLGASHEVALLAGLIVLVSPGGFDGALFAWAESLARLVVVGLVFLVWRAATEPTTSRLVTLAVVAGVTPFVHGRFVSIVAATLLLFLVWALGRHARVWRLMLAVASLLSVYVAGRVCTVLMRGWLYRGSGAQELRLVRRLVQPHLWSDIVRETGGQVWYSLAASAGLALVAALWMARQSLGRPSRLIEANKSGVGAISLFMMSTGAVIVVLGSLQLARAERGDQFIYGRHVEAFLPVFLTVGVVAVAKSGHRLNRQWLVGAVSILGVSVVYATAQRQDIVRQWVNLNGPLKTANVLAVDGMADVVGKEGLLSLGVGFTIVAVIVVVFHRRIGHWALLGLAAVMFASSLYTARTTMVERTWMYRAIGTVSERIDRSRDVTVGYDGRTLHDKRYFALRFLLHPAQLRWLDVSGGPLNVPADIRCVYGHADRVPGGGQWRVVDQESGIDRVLWMRTDTDQC